MRHHRGRLKRLERSPYLERRELEHYRRHAAAGLCSASFGLKHQSSLAAIDHSGAARGGSPIHDDLPASVPLGPTDSAIRLTPKD
jgi:hypothetical protein